MKTDLIFLIATILASIIAQGKSSASASSSYDASMAQIKLQTLISHASFVMKLHQKSFNPSCTTQNMQVRREWGTLSAEERITYTNAVQCLQTKSAISPKSWAPGVRTRFDDWVATHIDQTLRIHYTGTFLGWHRYFLWEYEQALRNECGYRGTQPYWNWGITAVTGLELSPVWDGSATSMSGNGVKINQTGLDLVLGGEGRSEIILPVGSGGGCVTSGPFANMSVNLGPTALALPGKEIEINHEDPMAYNPRCLKRDLTDYINQKFANATTIVDNIVRPQDVYDFQMTMQGWPGSGNIGIHGGGHYSMGGDPGRDIYVSPGDPAFYLHHSMIDLVWTLWQMLDAESRVYGDKAISGTGTFLNSPSSPNTTFSTPISIGWAGSGRNVTMRDVMSTVNGPFCYIYA